MTPSPSAPGRGGEGPEDEGPPAEPIADADLAERRQRLDRALAERRPASRADTGRAPRAGMAGMAEGLKIGSEFVAGVLVGAGIGYLIDLGLGTSPFGLIVFLLLGFAAGVLNVLRAVGKGPPPSGPVAPKR